MSIIEEMARAMRASVNEDEIMWRWDDLARAALNVVVRRLREPSEEMSDVIWMAQHDGCTTTPVEILSALADFLAKE